MATLANTVKTFTDLDLTFAKNPITGDVVKKVDNAAIKQSVINLVTMNPYDFPFHPEISSQVTGMLFELDSPITRTTIKTMIIDVLSKFEPRIQIIDVTVTTTNTGYRVLIDFYIIGSDQPVQVSTLLTRTL